MPEGQGTIKASHPQGGRFLDSQEVKPGKPGLTESLKNYASKARHQQS